MGKDRMSVEFEKDLNSFTKDVKTAFVNCPRFLFFSKFSGKYGKLVEETFQLHDSLSSGELTLDSKGLKEKLLDLQMRKRLLDRSILWLRIFAIVGLAVVLLVLVFWKPDIVSGLVADLGINGTAKYILLGISGAVIYFAKDTLRRIEKGEITTNVSLLRFIIRCAFSIIIPVVIVIVFFSKSNSNGNSEKLETDMSSLLCFAAGYSTELVVVLLNKIVEKGKMIIEAI